MVRLGDRCPGGAHIVAARDGGLARVRVPGGLPTLAQFRALAEIATRYGDGAIDITSRANCQLRGIPTARYAQVTAALKEAGLLPALAHDRIRNIFASPLSGCDANELLDMRPYVYALDQALIQNPIFALLPAKTSFVLDGGGYALDLQSTDFALRAVRRDTQVCLRLYIGGTPTTHLVLLEAMVTTLLTAARLLLDFLGQADGNGRRALGRSPAYRTALAQVLPHAQTADPLPAEYSTRPAQELVGLIATPFADQVVIVPRVPLGRLLAQAASGLVDVACKHHLELRLAPWRGLLLVGVKKSALNGILAELGALGLSLRADDGFAGLAACAGISGCEYALADVRTDAHRLAKALEGQQPMLDGHLNLAGCEKRCAMRTDTGLTFVAQPNGYARYEGGTIVPTLISSDALIDAVVADARKHARGAAPNALEIC